MKKYIIGFYAVALLLSACSVSKDITNPTYQAPIAFRDADTKTTGDSSIANIQWKSFFTEPDLQNLIDTAIIRNYDMQIAVKNIEAAELLFKQVKWNYVPQADLNVTANSSRPSDNSLNGISLSQFIGAKHIEDYSANIALSWEADIWGKIKSQQKRA